jgi:hypothetical protein
MRWLYGLGVLLVVVQLVVLMLILLAAGLLVGPIGIPMPGSDPTP